MDLGEQADQVKFMIRDRGSNFTGLSSCDRPLLLPDRPVL
jgi:hypothetical protein